MTQTHYIVLAALAVALLAYLLIVFAIAHRFTTAKRVTPPAPTGAWAEGFTRIDFRARGDAVKIVAWYRAAPSSGAAVIMVHGRDSCRGDELRRSTFALADRIVAADMSVLMIDLRGHGDSGDARLTFGRHECRDVLGAVDFLLSRGYEPTRIGVFGASMGGVSAIAAAADESAIGALVTDSAFADLDTLLRLQFCRLTRLPVVFLRGALLAARVLTGTHLTVRAPLQLIRELRGRPVLVIHAAGDPFVPVAHAHLLGDAGGADVWITGGQRHLSSAASVGARYTDVVVRFFARALVSRPVRCPCSRLRCTVHHAARNWARAQSA